MVLESTTYPGTTEDLLRPLLETGSGLRSPGDFYLGYSPERIDPGNPTWRLENTPKVVSGVDAASLAAGGRVLRRLVERTVPVDSTRVAELTKLIENTFRQVNIALVNELAMLSPRNSASTCWEAIDAAATKPFGFMPFRPGPGVGGHCLPIDPSLPVLAGQADASASSSGSSSWPTTSTTTMPEHVVQRIVAGLNRAGRPVSGAAVLLLGLAYKKNTGDMRESPGGGRGPPAAARSAPSVRAVEPYAEPRQLPGRRATLVELTEARGGGGRRGGGASPTTTAFDYELVQRHARYVFDTRNRCTGGDVEPL